VGFQISVLTFLRLKPGATVERMRPQLSELMNGLWPRRPPGLGASMDLLRIDRVHLFPPFDPGVRSRLAGTTVIGALILILASVNFVNLATSRSVRRALEVSIRKVAGADRSTIMLQCLGESLLHVLLATLIAVALTECVIPYINAFLDTNIRFEYWHQPSLLAAILAGALVLALLAGWYPALVVSACRPAAALRGVFSQSPGAGVLWKSLVVLQFAILTSLMIAAGVVYQQQIYATHNALRVKTDQLLVIESPCTSALRDELRRVPGVRRVACSARSILSGRVFDNVRLKDGGALAIGLVAIDAGTLEMYGLEPLAGRFFRAESTGESSASPPANALALRYIVNESAATALGYASPAAAIAQPLRLSDGSGEIIGVVRDFSLDSIRQRITPALYLVWPRDFELITLQLSGQQIPESLAAIDRLWLAMGATEPIKRYFVNDYIQNLYRGVLREAQAFGMFSVIAVLLAALGLFGLSASITERRTKEIGIRKAMGAGTADVMRLLMWQFTTPVLWANLVAWPASAYLMSRWLHGFAYRIELSPWLFITAMLLGLVIAQTTVAAHCYLVARRSPAITLRRS
jgi:putative ABC transport system permease protein